ncbi:hypothetical protein NLI96_g9847 [Meripilus lineatus]|uniref:Hamartin n=1 Tax=Meripilus lineatus TaxID=2056292 RepID=A0AAD5UUZ9_9APHY|nr:hypothetical protein NLI96_g9847 [Physisporinus lineatus]
MSASASDIPRQLHLTLKNSQDAPSLPALLQRVDDFVSEACNSPLLENLLGDLEDALQKVHKQVVDHTILSQVEVFVSVIYHLLPILPPSSVISTWFELVLRPALREPKLPTQAVEYAKELIVASLQPVPIAHASGSDDKEKDSKWEKVGYFRRRLMDLYLLDAYNDSSGDDILEWAKMNDTEREKMACWKANLEDILVRAGLQRPQPDFPTKVAAVMAAHPVMQSLLYSLLFDISSTACNIGLKVLTKLLPIFAVHACERLKELLPQLLLILARVISWRTPPPSGDPFLPSVEGLGLAPDILKAVTDEESTPNIIQTEFRDPFQIRPDIEWQRLDIVFTLSPFPPPPQQYFAFLYYLFPCNVVRFLRLPVGYLSEVNADNPYGVSWDVALDEGLIRSKAESLLRCHVLHPHLIYQDAITELSNQAFKFWLEFDISRIVAECNMLYVRNASLGLREYALANNTSTPKPLTPPPPSLPHQESGYISDSPILATLSSSVDSSVSSVLSHLPQPMPITKPRVSVKDMIMTSIALKSGLDIDIVDPVPSWPTVHFQGPHLSPLPQTPASSSQTGSETPVVAGRFASGSGDNDDNEVPTHVAQAIAELQRERLLLRSELNFELWMARENVKHIGRLYQDRVISRNSEMGRQALYNKMRELKAEVHRLQKSLKEHKEQASNMKSQYADWNRKLQDKVRDLKPEKASWAVDAAAMRRAEAEAKETFAAQGKLLAEANGLVFLLQTKIKETAHKVERLHDYEAQIEQLIKMQRIWESDVHKLNDQTEYIKVFTSNYKKMELRLESYEKTQAKMDEEAKQYRQNIQTLSSRLNITQQQLGAAQKIIFII